MLFEWHSWPRVGLAESYESLPKGKDAGDDWDYFHLNAVGPDTDGNLLLSARHTHTVYKVRRRTARSCGDSAESAATSRPGPARPSRGSTTPAGSRTGR